MLLLALQILNLSIDMQNFQPVEPKNTLCYFNEMNSIVELVTEKIITKRDTFPERGHSTNDTQNKRHAEISCFFPVEKPIETECTSAYVKHNYFLPASYSFLYYELQSPPPKSC